MMICNKCGKEIAEGAKFCPYCGETVEQQPQAQPQPEVQPQPQPQAQAQPQAQPMANVQPQAQAVPNTFAPPVMPMPGAPEDKIKTTRTLGLVALIVGIFIPLVGFICGGIGISKISTLKHSATPEQTERLNKNKKLCLAGIIVPIVIMVIEIIVSIVVAISALNFARKQIEDYAQDPDGYANRVQQDIENEVEDYFQKEYGVDIKDYEQQK